VRERFAYFLAGAIVGLVVGSVLGLLFAPVSGDRARRRLADEAMKAAEFAREVAERAERTAEVISGRVDRYFGEDEDIAWKKVAEIREGVDRYTQAHTAE
jgi:gas vesicle protein